MKNGYRVLFLPDTHIESTVGLSLSLKAALKFIKIFKPHETIIGGDFMDFDSISKFGKKNFLKREGKRLLFDFHLGNKVLDVIDKHTKDKVVYLYGNHEIWLDNLIAEEAPQLEGLVSVEKELRFKDRNYKIIPFNKVYKVGHARFIHGWYYNIYHARKTVAEMGASTFYGHTHDMQAFTKVNYDEKPMLGQSMGCLCDLNPSYKKNRPNRWVNGFGIFYFSSDGTFTPYNPILIKGKFWWNGKLINGGTK